MKLKLINLINELNNNNIKYNLYKNYKNSYTIIFENFYIEYHNKKRIKYKDINNEKYINLKELKTTLFI